MFEEIILYQAFFSSQATLADDGRGKPKALEEGSPRLECQMHNPTPHSDLVSYLKGSLPRNCSPL